MIFAILFNAFIHSSKINQPNSITKNFDSSSNSKNWVYGGDAFLTKKEAQLTPTRPFCSGWIRSINPIPSKEWTTVLNIKVDSNGHKGNGGAFALTFIDYISDSLVIDDFFSEQKHTLLLSKRKGFSLIIAPSPNAKNKRIFDIFVIDNMIEEDFEKLSLTALKNKKSRNTLKGFSCEVDIRSNPTPPKIYITYSSQRVTVFTRSQKSKNNKNQFCLDVKLSKEFVENPLLAMIASNEAGADSYKVQSILTVTKDGKKSLTNSSERTNDDFKHIQVIVPWSKGESGMYKKMRRFFWLWMVFCGLFLVLEVVWEIVQLNELTPERVNPILSIEAINKVIPYSYYVQIFLIAVFFCRLQFLTLLFLIIPAIFRLIRLRKKRILLKLSDFEVGNSKALYLFQLSGFLACHLYFTMVSIGNLISF